MNDWNWKHVTIALFVLVLLLALLAVGFEGCQARADRIEKCIDNHREPTQCREAFIGT